MSVRTDLEGKLLKHIGGQDPLYSVMDGILRWIPDIPTRNAVFAFGGDPTVNTEDLSSIKGFNLDYPLLSGYDPYQRLVVLQMSI